jgi:protein disulfide-isomerase
MMLDFTGSDWCVWCQKLDKEIFSTDAFKNYAKEKLVLVKLDFPKQHEVAEALKKQNVGLAQKYAVQGLPTVILLSPAGAKLGQMGYMEGGPDAFLPELKKAIGDTAKPTDESAKPKE